MIGADSSRTLFSKLDEFALFQGIVWEIEVPLKSSVLRQNSVDAGDLLKEADLLDFPGVANEFNGDWWLLGKSVVGASSLGTQSGVVLGGPWGAPGTVLKGGQ